MIGAGSQLALKLGGEIPPEPVPEPPVTTAVEIPDLSSVA